MTNDDLDPYAILRVLGLTDATSVMPVRGGSDTAIWQVERGGSIYALRVFGEGQYDNCEHEKLVMQATFAAGLPVSQVYAEASGGIIPHCSCLGFRVGLLPMNCGYDLGRLGSLASCLVACTRPSTHFLLLMVYMSIQTRGFIGWVQISCRYRSVCKRIPIATMHCFTSTITPLTF